MITILENYNLLYHNTFRLNANCKRWIEFTSATDLYDIQQELNEEHYFIIGGGSNILLTGAFEGTMLHSAIYDIEAEIDRTGDLIITAGSGIQLDSVIEYACKAGRWGIENLSGIPGDVGASVVQNVGAYGVEIKDVTDSVECFDLKNKTFISLRNRECEFSYRNSLFKTNKGRYVITAVKYRLSKTKGPNLEYGQLSELYKDEDLTPVKVRNAVISVRNKKLPNVEKIGSAGSYFKNPIISVAKFEELSIKHKLLKGTSEYIIPNYKISDSFVKVPAAWLIEQCGFKGKEYGNVGVWKYQPLVIVNLNGKATAAEIIDLEKKIIEDVFSCYGIILEPEVEHV